VVMEVSSHALEQERIYGLPFDVAVFTNLTRDHLDFHGDMESYFASKQKLFAGVGSPPPRVAVLNADDEYGAKLTGFASSQGSEVVTYGVGAGDVRADDIHLSAQKTEFTLRAGDVCVAISSPLAGRVNVYNLLAAACAANARGESWE